jgi:HAD superfamily hydrolase (TIGR01509 family)
VPTLDELTIRWQWALDAGSRALAAAASELPAGALERHRGVLAHERADTTALLDLFAREHHEHVHPWLSSLPVTPRLLGLQPDVRACVFDVDGVLADSGVLHATAWARVLDALLLRRAQEAERHFVPFDPVEDYRTYIDGRPRLDGVHTFLASRGIKLPTGEPDDPPEAETAYGVAAKKGVVLEHVIHQVGVSALPGARTFLVGAGFAHLGRAVVSTSATTEHVLQHAQLESLVDVIVTARSGLRARPAPDMLVAACERLGVRPERAVSLTRSGSGIRAAESAGMRVIGVAHGEQADELAHFGAERIVPTLAALVDPQLRAAANGDLR